MIKALVTIIDDETGKVYCKDIKIAPMRGRQYTRDSEITNVHEFSFQYAEKVDNLITQSAGDEIRQKNYDRIQDR